MRCKGYGRGRALCCCMVGHQSLLFWSSWLVNRDMPRLLHREMWEIFYPSQPDRLLTNPYETLEFGQDLATLNPVCNQIPLGSFGCAGRTESRESIRSERKIQEGVRRDVRILNLTKSVAWSAKCYTILV